MPKRKLPTAGEAQKLLREARAIVQAYNLLGCEGMGIGPADLGLGLEHLKALEDMAKFPFLCANLVDEDGKPTFPASAVITKGGVRFGVFSVIHTGLNSDFCERAIPGKKILDPLEAAKKVAAELRATSDVVICLSQLNIPESHELLETIPDVDVLVDPFSKMGNKSIWVHSNEFLTLHADKPVLRIDGQGSRVGVFEMFFNKGSGTLIEHAGYDAPLEPHLMDHPRMVDLLREARSSTTEVPLNYAPDDLVLVDDFLEEEACGGCHEDQHRFWKGTVHANTFASLEKTGDHERTDCIGCHTLAYGVAFAAPERASDHKEVQCESCHGLRPGHAENPRSVLFGEVKEATCWGCHNPSITQKDFDYAGTAASVSCPKMRR